MAYKLMVKGMCNTPRMQQNCILKGSDDTVMQF